MADYKDIGARIMKLRLEKGLTQEQLADAIGVGTTHISHIETGNTISSLQVFVDICNVLGCSADELLCIDIIKNRPIFTSWLSELVEDCSSIEIKVITDLVISIKDSMRRHRIEESRDKSNST